MGECDGNDAVDATAGRGAEEQKELHLHMGAAARLESPVQPQPL